jgi:ubiquinone/menaquinone biosynthesis C-methylase UbiE
MDKGKEYFRQLELFEETCDGLIRKGQPYLAVILCHELYRYTYPVEPYEHFTNTSPVHFILDHIRDLNALGARFKETVTPYAWKFPTGAAGKGAPVEKGTSDLFTALWEGFDRSTLVDESITLLSRMLTPGLIRSHVRGAFILDDGCGSGRFSIALALAGAGKVYAIDYQRKSYAAAKKYCTEEGLPVTFFEGTVLDLPFEDSQFDFVFSKGVLHHTRSLGKGVRELHRVLKPGGKAFLYIYGSGGIFWETRNVMRRIFRKIPFEYTNTVLKVMGVPGNRVIFCDTWYVPIETQTKRKDQEALLGRTGFSFRKIIGRSAFHLDRAIASHRYADAELMWGDGEHRYLLTK